MTRSKKESHQQPEGDSALLPTKSDEEGMMGYSFLEASVRARSSCDQISALPFSLWLRVLRLVGVRRDEADFLHARHFLDGKGCYGVVTSMHRHGRTWGRAHTLLYCGVNREDQGMVDVKEGGESRETLLHSYYRRHLAGERPPKPFKQNSLLLLLLLLYVIVDLHRLEYALQICDVYEMLYY